MARLPRRRSAGRGAGLIPRCAQGGARTGALVGDVAAREALRTRRTDLLNASPRFLVEAESFYALALDGDKVVRVSPPTRALGCGRLVPDDRALVAKRLPATTCSPVGHPTLCAREADTTVSYHNGSVWPHDNGIAAGASVAVACPRSPSRCRRACSMRPGTSSAAPLPELFCGSSAGPGTDALVQVACSRQWGGQRAPGTHAMLASRTTRQPAATLVARSAPWSNSSSSTTCVSAARASTCAQRGRDRASVELSRGAGM